MRTKDQIVESMREVMKWSVVGDENFWEGAEAHGIDKDALAEAVKDHSSWPEMISLRLCEFSAGTIMSPEQLEIATQIATIFCCEIAIGYMAGLIDGRQDALES